MMVLLMLFWVLLLCLGLAYGLLCYKWRRARQYLSKLPSFPRLPILGNINYLSGDGRATYRLVFDISKIMEETSLPCVFWIGPYPLLFISDPDDVKAVTTKFLAKPYFYDFARIWLGDGLGTARPHLWKSTIKKLGGTFSTSVVENYLGVFNAQARKLAHKLKYRAGEDPIDVYHDLGHTTLEAICQIAFGAGVADKLATKDYYKAIHRTLELFISRAMNIFLHLDCIYRLSPAYKEQLRYISLFDSVCTMAIKERKKELEKRKYDSQLDKDTKAEKFETYLDILMKLHVADPMFTEEQIKAELNTIVLGGQETNATTLLFVFLMLGRYKHVQDKLYDEMKEIFGDSKRDVQKEDLARMKYCDAVLYETLRLYPPVPAMVRYADEELQLKSCCVPSLTACVINTWFAGRSRRVWGPDAEEFKPERWLQDEPPPGYPTSFFVFSYGRRACIGKKYAMTITKTILAHCVREFEIVSDIQDLELKIDVALRAVSGHLIQVRLRS